MSAKATGNTTGLEWLDKIIAQQATYYGTTPERMTKAMSDMAEAQEIAEATNEFAFTL